MILLIPGATAGTEVAVSTLGNVSGVVDAISANLGVLLPVGLTILGIMVGVALIPRIIYKFF